MLKLFPISSGLELISEQNQCFLILSHVEQMDVYHFSSIEWIQITFHSHVE
jgi:hypothetical protein